MASVHDAMKHTYVYAATEHTANTSSLKHPANTSCVRHQTYSRYKLASFVASLYSLPAGSDLRVVASYRVKMWYLAIQTRKFCCISLLNLQVCIYPSFVASLYSLASCRVKMWYLAKLASSIHTFLHLFTLLQV